MANYAPELHDPTAVLTMEVDLADWVEQHSPVSLPDDEYPRADMNFCGYRWL